MNGIDVTPASWCQHEYRACEAGCPLEGAESRLREAHRRWHDCLDGYQSPEDFRDALNSAIQALRNVTFLMQSSKRSIPGFAEWYAVEQEGMKLDPVLRWIVNARNMVVKEGDLETYSRLEARVVLSYEDEARNFDREQRTWSDLLSAVPSTLTQKVTDVPVNTSVPDVIQTMAEHGVPLVAQNDATVVVERSWVLREMPSYEILTLLAHAYGRLRSLVSRCHDLLEMDAVVLVPKKGEPGQYDVQVVGELPFGGRRECMVSSAESRTSRYRLLDAKKVITHSEGVDPAQIIDPEKLVEAYGEQPDFPHDALSDIQTVDEINALLDWYGQKGVGILRSGQDHVWISHYFRSAHSVDIQMHFSSDKQGKMAIAGDIARRALRRQADLVIVIGEVWQSSIEYTVDGAYLPPKLNPNRSEALAVYAVAKSGAEGSLLIPFTTLGGEPPERRVQIGEPKSHLLRNFGILEPLRRAWKLGGRRSKRGDSFFRRA